MKYKTTVTVGNEEFPMKVGDVLRVRQKDTLTTYTIESSVPFTKGLSWNAVVEVRKRTTNKTKVGY